MLPTLASKAFFFLTSFAFKTPLLTYLLLCVGMAGKGKNKFTKVACAARKGKVVVGISGPPPKRARRAKEIIMLLLPPPPPATEETTLA